MEWCMDRMQDFSCYLSAEQGKIGSKSTVLNQKNLWTDLTDISITL